MNAKEVKHQKEIGYSPIELYNKIPQIKHALDFMEHGIYGNTFSDIVNSLKYNDPYMVLADFVSYYGAQEKAAMLYKNHSKWYKMSAINIANAGYFSADRAVREYSENIWELDN